VLVVSTTIQDLTSLEASMIRVHLVAALIVALLTCAIAGEEPPLTLVQTIPLPGVDGRIDHFGLDAVAHRLYVAALGNNTVEVIDLQSGAVVRRITGLKEPQGVVVIPDPHQVVVANGDDGTVAFFDASTYGLLHTIDLKGDADNVRYDPEKRLVYVGYGSGGIATIDPVTRTVTASVPVPRHPECLRAGDRWAAPVRQRPRGARDRRPRPLHPRRDRHLGPGQGLPRVLRRRRSLQPELPHGAGRGAPPALRRLSPARAHAGVRHAGRCAGRAGRDRRRHR
jgi:YVTN family beta-propeller protein